MKNTSIQNPNKIFQNTPIQNTAITISQISDRELYRLCKEYGGNTRKWAREFGFLLPEVAKRHLYRKYKYQSIYEFSAKLAGMSYDVTGRILNLAGKLKDKPLIWNEFRRYGWTKLRVAANIATPSTDAFWADKIKKLPLLALKEFIRVLTATEKLETEEEKNLFNFVHKENEENGEQGFIKPETCGAPKLVNEKKHYKKLKFKVDEDTEFEFRKFKQKFEKEKKESLTMGETLKLLMKKVTDLEKKSETAENAKVEAIENAEKKPESVKIVSESVPIRIQKYISKRSHYRCEFPGCTKPYLEFHHADRFSITRIHDPDRIFALCRMHHSLAHAGLIDGEDLSVENWKIRKEADKMDFKYVIDQRVMNYSVGGY